MLWVFEQRQIDKIKLERYAEAVNTRRIFWVEKPVGPLKFMGNGTCSESDVMCRRQSECSRADTGKGGQIQVVESQQT